MRNVRAVVETIGGKFHVMLIWEDSGERFASIMLTDPADLGAVIIGLKAVQQEETGKRPAPIKIHLN